VVKNLCHSPEGPTAPLTVNLLAEADISTYHVYVGFSGPINNLDVTLRSDPELTRSEILALPH